MARKKIDRKKAVIVGIIWSIAYFSFILYYVGNDLGFNLLSAKDWESTYIAFMAGQFAIEPDKLILLLLTLILLVPVWLIGWKAFYSVNWRVPRFLLHRKEVQFKRELIIAPNKSKLQAPVKLRLQSSNPYSGLKKEAFGDLPEVPATTPNTHHVVSVVEKTTGAADIQDIIAYADQYSVDTFKDVVLDGAKIPLAISTDDKAILITLLDTPDATWIIDVSDEESEWYSESSHIPSPTAFIRKAADALKALEPDSQVIPAVVVTNGEIYDAADIAKHYEAMGIQILRFKNGGPTDLTPLESFIDAHFVSKINNTSTQQESPDTVAVDDVENILNNPVSFQGEDVNNIDENTLQENDEYAQIVSPNEDAQNAWPDELSKTFNNISDVTPEEQLFDEEFVLTNDMKVSQYNENIEKNVKDDTDETN